VNWKFWKSVETGQPHAPNDEPVSGWRAARAKVFSKNYSATRWMLVTTSVLFFLTAPVQPWIPDKSELHELVGMPKFQHYLTSSESGIHFSVDGVLMHCDFTGMGGGNGCDHYEELVTKGEPVRATYFYMTAHYLVSYRMLNTLEQDGRVVVSADDSYRGRLISVNSGRKTRAQLTTLFSLMVIGLWLAERSKAKPTSTNIPF